MDYFWKNYQFLCAKKGVSVYTAAKECGVQSSASVSYWRKGSKPKSENLSRMLQYFDVDPYDFFYVDLEAKEKTASIPPAVDDPLYCAIQELSPVQQQLVRGFVAGLKANQTTSL